MLRLGKIDLKRIKPEGMVQKISQAGFEFLSLEPETAASFYKLPRGGHRDPFDRMLVWQAIGKGWPLLSKDKGLDIYKKYGLTRVW